MHLFLLTTVFFPFQYIILTCKEKKGNVVHLSCLIHPFVFFQYGIVTCTDKIGDCPPISCPYPETEPGSCCPVCKPKDCVINGVVFKEGLTFTNPDDRCQDCQCDRGQPRCRTRSCPEVRCRYPSFTADKCCQECVGELKKKWLKSMLLLFHNLWGLYSGTCEPRN